MEQACLARTVRGRFEKGRVALEVLVERGVGGDRGVKRADVDDRAAAGVAHRRAEDLDGVERADEVDVQRAAEGLGWYVLDTVARSCGVGRLVDSRPVDQHRRRPEVGKA